MIKGLEADVSATRAMHEGIAGVDVGCCNACAVYVEAVKRGVFPSAFMKELKRAGIDPLRPVEVWGIPEDGFLNGFFVFVGDVRKEWAGEADGAFESPAPGFKYWASGDVSMLPSPKPTATPLAQIEFVWEDKEALGPLAAVVSADAQNSRGV